MYLVSMVSPDPLFRVGRRETILVVVGCMYYYVINAPINVLPHYPPLGHIWGYSGDLTQPNIKCPIVGQTYRVKSPPLAPVATRDLLGI